jgi:hypothetical protein
MQELRDAIQTFSQVKKAQFGEDPKVIAYADTFASQGRYYIASACDQINMEPLGSIPLLGLGTRSFVR